MRIKTFTSYQFLWCLGLLISLAFIIGSVRYGIPDRPVRMAIAQFDAKLFLRLHIGGGAIWLISGFMQFTPYFQSRLKWHKINGYIYFITALISTIGLVGINLKLQKHSLFLKDPIIFSVYTIVCLLLSYFYVKKKEITLHRAWIIRSMVPALEIPFNRLLSMLEYLFHMQFSFNHFVFLMIIGEIVILKKMNFSLLRPTDRKSNYLLMVLYLVLLLLAFGLVFYWQFFLEHKRGTLV